MTDDILHRYNSFFTVTVAGRRANFSRDDDGKWTHDLPIAAAVLVEGKDREAMDRAEDLLWALNSGLVDRLTAVRLNRYIADFVGSAKRPLRSKRNHVLGKWTEPICFSLALYRKRRVAAVWWPEHIRSLPAEDLWISTDGLASALRACGARPEEAEGRPGSPLKLAGHQGRALREYTGAYGFAHHPVWTGIAMSERLMQLVDSTPKWAELHPDENRDHGWRVTGHVPHHDPILGLLLTEPRAWLDDIFGEVLTRAAGLSGNMWSGSALSAAESLGRAQRWLYASMAVYALSKSPGLDYDGCIQAFHDLRDANAGAVPTHIHEALDGRLCLGDITVPSGRGG